MRKENEDEDEDEDEDAELSSVGGRADPQIGGARVLLSVVRIQMVWMIGIACLVALHGWE